MSMHISGSPRGRLQPIKNIETETINEIREGWTPVSRSPCSPDVFLSKDPKQGVKCYKHAFVHHSIDNT